MKTVKHIPARLLIVLTLLFSFYACDSGSEEDEIPEEDNTSAITNNSLTANGVTKQLTKFTYGNSGGYVEITARESLNAGVPNIAIRIKEIPTSNTTLTFQYNSSDPAQLQTDEFWTQMNDGAQVWYPVFSTTAFVTTGTLSVTIGNGTATFAYSEIELNDSYLSANVTQTIKCSGKFTIPTSNLTDGMFGDLED